MADRGSRMTIPCTMRQFERDMARSMATSTTSPIHRVRVRLTLTVLATVLLAGCSSDGNGDFRMMFDVARSIVDPPVTTISLQQASAVPHATMGVRIGGGSEILTILAAFEPGQLWVTGKQLAIVTRRGRIVRTAGLEHNLVKLSVDLETDFSPIDIARGQPSRSRWSVQLDDHGFL